MHLPPSKCVTWSYGVRNFPLLVVPLLCGCSHPQDDVGAGALHLPLSKREAWSHEVRNFTHEMFDCGSELPHPGGGSTASGTSSEGARAAGGNFVLRTAQRRCFFFVLRTAQRRRWTTAGAMHLHPPENSLCCRKIEFSTVWDEVRSPKPL